MALIGLVSFFVGQIDPSYYEAKYLFDLICFVFSSTHFFVNTFSNFICSKSGDETLMCPLCDECTSWHLSDICSTQKLNRLFDNCFTVIFSVLMNVWGEYQYIKYKNNMNKS